MVRTWRPRFFGEKPRGWARGPVSERDGRSEPRVWALVVLSTACLIPRPAGAAEPIGAARCGTCHQEIYDSWKTSAHARSLANLSETQQGDPACRSCHTLAPSSTDAALEGVQCESCHGLGSNYAPEHVMRDPRLARLLGLVDEVETTCRACHDGVKTRLRPYDAGAMLKAVSHEGVRTAPERGSQ